MSKTATAIVAYVFGLLGVLIGYLAGDKEGAKFDLNQALVIGIGFAICNIIGRISIISFIGTIGNLLFLVLAIMGIINAAKGVEKELPIIGGIKILN